MVGVWDVCPCMDNVFRDMQIGDCPTGVLVSYSISNRLCVPTPSACAKPDPLLDSSAVRLKALLRGRYNMIIGLTTNAYIVEGSVDIDIYSTDISIFEEHGVLIRGLYNVTTGSHLSDTDTVRLHSAYFDGSQAGDAPTATCATRNTTGIAVTPACNQIAIITPRFTHVCHAIDDHGVDTLSLFWPAFDDTPPLNQSYCRLPQQCLPSLKLDEHGVVRGRGGAATLAGQNRDDVEVKADPYPVLWDSNSIDDAALEAVGIQPNARKAVAPNTVKDWPCQDAPKGYCRVDGAFGGYCLQGRWPIIKSTGTLNGG